MTPYIIRQSKRNDETAILAMYPDVFPEEDLCPLVEKIFKERDGIFSLIAVVGKDIIGHVIFTRCGVENHHARIGLLGPLAVAPTFQGQGIGTALVRNGFNPLLKQSIDTFCVLGDPQYYKRFGFVQENNIMPPYPIPNEWQTGWQSICLKNYQPAIKGKLTIPSPWQEASLWSL